MRYRAVPLAALVERRASRRPFAGRGQRWLRRRVAGRPLLAEQGSQAWLAIEDPQRPWPPLGAGKPSAGPFYLVWSKPEEKRIGPEQWPFQVVRIRYQSPLAERFPALLPAADASAEVRAGFAVFRRTAWPATVSTVPATPSSAGPEPAVQPHQYFQPQFLARYIRDPQALRQWPGRKCRRSRNG